MNKDFKKAEKMLEDVKQVRINALVRARKGELWIEENTEQYSLALKDFNHIKHDLKEFIEIKKYPFWMHIIPQLKMFLDQPFRYITGRHQFIKNTIKSYWKYKTILKEWDDDFEMTEKAINKDYEFVEGSQKHIKEIEQLINRWRNKLTKIKKLKRKYK